jgi:acetolactate synthase-1/2/3 large subunit
MTHPSRTGGQILVDALSIHGVDTAFGVPGESYLDVLDALHDSNIRFVINRQEGGAAFMAEAYGKLTGRAPPMRRSACTRRTRIPRR